MSQKEASNIMKTSAQDRSKDTSQKYLQPKTFHSVPSVPGKHSLGLRWDLQTSLLNESLCYKASLATQISLGALAEDNL